MIIIQITCYHYHGLNIQLSGHFHWLRGAGPTRGSHAFHFNIFLTKDNSRCACRKGGDGEMKRKEKISH